MIAAQDLDVWITSPSIQDPDLLASYRSLLSPDELERQGRFVFPHHRQAFLVTRALVRTTLSHYVPKVAPAEWVFYQNEYGRPEVSATQAGGPLRFNISHTDEWIVCLVNYAFDAGIDVETTTRVKQPTQLAEHFFSQEEIAELFALPEAERRQRFFCYWTLGEAYIKAKGMGLSIPLDHFGFSLDEMPKIQASFRPSLGDDPREWQFGLWRLAPDVLLALALHNKSTPTYRLSMKQVIPLLEGAQGLKLPVVATSLNER